MKRSQDLEQVKYYPTTHKPQSELLYLAQYKCTERSESLLVILNMEDCFSLLPISTFKRAMAITLG